MKWRPKTIEEHALAVELAKRCASVESLAPYLGISVRAVQNARSAGFASPLMRAQIERFLGVPIWTQASVFVLRTVALRIWGFDPFCQSRRFLFAEFRRRIRGVSAAGFSREQLAEQLLAHLAVNMPPEYENNSPH